MKVIKYTAIVAALMCGAIPAEAADWSVNEVHYQIGELKNPFTDTRTTTHILTFQHASSWRYGNNFFFIDMIDDGKEDNYNDTDYYGEWYSNFSLGKITGADLSFGPIKDVGLIAGLNVAGDANIRKYLPGVRFSWDVPGFAYLNTDLTAYIDDSDVAQGDSFMFDVNWAYPIDVGQQKFSISGHVEYIGERNYEQAGGAKINGHVLAQPQFRWDLGHALFDTQDQLYVGIEYQYWNNKQGTNKDESVAQGLAVWRF